MSLALALRPCVQSAKTTTTTQMTARRMTEPSRTPTMTTATSKLCNGDEIRRERSGSRNRNLLRRPTTTLFISLELGQSHVL